MAVTHSVQVAENGVEAERDMSFNIFEEYPSGVDLSDNSGHVGPEVALIVGTLALAGGAERLAGISGEDGVDVPAPGLPVETGDIVPDRGGREVSGPLGSDEALLGVCLPLDVTARVEAGFGEHEAHVEATAAGT